VPSRDDALPKIGAPATRALASIGITRLSQVGDRSDAELLALHGFGPRALRILREALKSGGPPEMKATNLAALYDLETLDWEPIAARLSQDIGLAPGNGGPDRHSCWLATINADGSPHVTGIGAQWVDGTWWFETGPTTRKARNLARDSRCSLSIATTEFDVVVEGEAHRITDKTTVAQMAKIWADGGWPCKVDESGEALTAEFSAPSAGPPPWHVYRVTPHAATALQVVAPGGATRWRM
jgi:hypothetical protein